MQKKDLRISASVCVKAVKQSPTEATEPCVYTCVNRSQSRPVRFARALLITSVILRAQNPETSKSLCSAFPHEKGTVQVRERERKTAGRRRKQGTRWFFVRLFGVKQIIVLRDSATVPHERAYAATCLLSSASCRSKEGSQTGHLKYLQWRTCTPNQLPKMVAHPVFGLCKTQTSSVRARARLAGVFSAMAKDDGARTIARFFTKRPASKWPCACECFYALFSLLSVLLLDEGVASCVA